MGPINMVRGTEVHDGLKFQEKYLQRESAKKFFFRSGKFLNLDFFILSIFFKELPTDMISDHVCRQFYAILVTINMVRGTEVHDGLKFQEKYLQRESAKKIFFFDLENS